MHPSLILVYPILLLTFLPPLAFWRQRWTEGSWVGVWEAAFAVDLAVVSVFVAFACFAGPGPWLAERIRCYGIPVERKNASLT